MEKVSVKYHLKIFEYALNSICKPKRFKMYVPFLLQDECNPLQRSRQLLQD